MKPDAPRAVVVESETARRVVTDGGAVRFGFRCNPLYSPQGVWWRSARGVAAGPEVIALQDVKPGYGSFDLPELPDGEYRLAIEMRDQAGMSSLTQTYELRVLRQPVELCLPDTSAQRFL